MLPRDLKPEQFNGYPPEAKKLVLEYIGPLQRLPLSFVPSLLREVVDYDFKFPVERTAVERELANLSSLSQEQVERLVSGLRPNPDFIRNWKVSTGLMPPLSLSNSFRLIFGLRTSWIRFAPPQLTMPAVCGRRFRQKHPQRHAWGSPWLEKA